MDRRSFLKRSVFLTSVSALTGCARDVPDTEAAPLQFPRINFGEAFRLSREIGIGTASLEGPKSVEAGSYGTWTIVVTAWRAGIASGGGIRIGLRHLNDLWSPIQNKDPKADGFVTVQSPSSLPPKVSISCGIAGPFFASYFPYQNLVELIFDSATLRPNQTVRITYGDRAGGSAGFKVQPFTERRYRFMVYVDVSGNGRFLPIEESPWLEIVAGPPKKLVVVAPSDAVGAQPTWCTVRAEDGRGNVAESYRGTVRLLQLHNQTPREHTFTPSDAGIFRFEGLVLAKEGSTRWTAADGKFTAKSNPVVVHQRPPSRRLLWGDIHGHSELSDGRGTPAEYYEHARRMAALDFAALTDHDFELPDEAWKKIQHATNAANHPGQFTTLQAYEWSGTKKCGGDHNVYFLDDAPPIYRSVWEGPENFQWAHETGDRAADLPTLFRLLKRHRKGNNVMVIAHRGGRAANPQWHDPDLQRLVETSSEHFRSLPWAQEFLNRGYRLGLMASSDSHYGHAGYGYLNHWFDHGLIGEGLVAVLAEDNTRRGVFSALYDRHCYATTGDRIVLDFRVDGALMGSEIHASKAPTLTVKAIGTVGIRQVEILKEGRPVHQVKPGSELVDFAWRDPAYKGGTSTYYYVKVVQENDEEACSSPVWVDP